MKKLALYLILFHPLFINAQTGLEHLDAAFNDSGYAIYNHLEFDYIKGMAIQPDDKILLSGSSDLSTIGLIRHNANGTVDQTYGNNGAIVATGYDSTYQRYSTLSIQSDGKALLAYSSYPINGDTVNNDENWLHIQRYNTNGTLDNTFGVGGNKIISFDDYELLATRIVPMDNGSIIISGIRYAGFGTQEAILIKLGANGEFDNEFGINGFCILDQGGSFFINNWTELDDSGNIYIAGRFGSYNCILKVLSDGSGYDNSFGISGMYTSTLTTNMGINKAVFRPDGKILMMCENFPASQYLTLLNANGTIDSQFGDNGIRFTGYNNSIFTLLDDGKIVVSGGKFNSPGNGDIALAVYDSNGQQNQLFGNNGEIVLDISNESASYIDLQSNGRLIVGGRYENIAIDDTANSSDYLLVCYYPLNSILNSLQSTSSKYLYSVYPNPTSSTLTIKVNENTTLGTLTCTIYTTQGQLVQQQNLNNVASSVQINLNPELPAGMYYLNLKNNTTNSTIRFIKQ